LSLPTFEPFVAALLCYLHALHAGFSAGQLPELAAAHPEAYARFINCCVRSPQLQACNMAAAAEQLSHAVTAVVSSAAALANTAAVAALASAVTSLVKRTVQFTEAAVLLKGQQLDQDSDYNAAAAYFLVAVSYIVDEVLQKLVKGLGAVFSSSSSSSNNNSSTQLQARASAALLAVVAARSIMQLADAMEAAGPQLLLASHNAAPAFKVAWGSAFTNAMICNQIRSAVPERMTVWQHWIFRVQDTVTHLCVALYDLGLLLQPQQHAATAATQAAGIAAAVEQAGTATSSSSSTGVQSRWSYLLRLQQSSKKWRAAAEREASSRDMAIFRVLAAAMHGSSSMAAGELERCFKESLQLVRTLAAVAPLPVVCNNPSCDNLAGVSEAAAACKVCAGCRCRYCSAACQRGDWLRRVPAGAWLLLMQHVCESVQRPHDPIQSE
jgi:hypothetical protein